MEQHLTQNSEASFAAQAFSDLRGEVGLLRRAIEHLASERAAQPDYGPSLEAISKGVENIVAWARRINEKPAMALTPDRLANDIVEAAATSREADQKMLQGAVSAMRDANGRIDATIAKSRLVHEQNRELKRNRAAFGVAGIVLWAILPGAVARSLPVSWAVPERMAARMLGLDLSRAAEDMKLQAQAHESVRATPAMRRPV